jgi:hypothetical protein
METARDRLRALASARAGCGVNDARVAARGGVKKKIRNGPLHFCNARNKARTGANTRPRRRWNAGRSIFARGRRKNATGRNEARTEGGGCGGGRYHGGRSVLAMDRCKSGAGSGTGPEQRIGALQVAPRRQRKFSQRPTSFLQRAATKREPRGAFDFCNGSPQKWNGAPARARREGCLSFPNGRAGQGRSAKLTAPVVIQNSYAPNLWITETDSWNSACCTFTARLRHGRDATWGEAETSASMQAASWKNSSVKTMARRALAKFAQERTPDSNDQNLPYHCRSMCMSGSASACG